jgi:hypothetical protein
LSVAILLTDQLHQRGSTQREPEYVVLEGEVIGLPGTFQYVEAGFALVGFA